MQDNKVWELVQLPEGVKPIGCKYIFKTKQYSNGNVERYKVGIMARVILKRKGLTLKILSLWFHRKTLLGEPWLLLHIMIL